MNTFAGFLKLHRRGGLELLEEDSKAFLLLTQIALRAKRTHEGFSRIPLKPNQAFLGDHEKIGLSSQEYRSAKGRLTRYGLATFKPTNRGTIATLASTYVYEINAVEEPSDLSIENQEKEQPKHTQKTYVTSPGTLQSTTQPLQTRRGEEKNAKKTTTPLGDGDLYASLQPLTSLSLEDKRSLMQYPEDRVAAATEWASTHTIKKSLIGALHWHCQQKSIPATNASQVGQTPQQLLAWEYNRFLTEYGYEDLVSQNLEAIPSGHVWIVRNGPPTTVILNNPEDALKKDLAGSKKCIIEVGRKGHER